MAKILAVGTVVAIASTYGTASNMTALTNAANAVATLAAGHGVVVGDFVEITSGWGLLSGRIARVSAVATNDVTLEGINTTSTSLYPTGQGTGSIRRITAWTNLSQITADLAVSGGEQQFADVTEITDRTQQQIPTTRSPVVVELPIYDDPALPWVSIVRNASDSAVATAVRMIFPNGSRLVGNAFWSLGDVPTIEDSTLRNSVTLTFTGQPTRYAT
jgi:hypothetical protein